ncbi:MAG: type II toxin-antitoxin system HicA family toxin [Minisyncoccia bacterium]
MPKPISVKNLIQNLRRLDFVGPYSGGRHMFMTKGNLKLHIPNPHKGDISKGLLSEILRQAGVKSNEWSKLS